MTTLPRRSGPGMKTDFFNITLLLGCVSLWLLIALGDILPGSLPDIIVFDAVILFAVAGVCSLLKARSFNLAAMIFLCCIKLIAAQIALTINFSPALYVVPFAFIVALIILTPRWIALTLLFDAVLIQAAAPPDQAPILAAMLLGHLALVGALKRYFARELAVSQGFQDYAAEQMRQARESRAALVLMSKQLREYQERLRVTNQKLEVAFEQAEESRQLKARFAANVSHELRTPINLIVGFSEVIIQAPEVYEQPLPKSYRADIHAIYRNARHLQNLINDVLDISQLEARHLAIVKQKTSLGDCVRESAAMVADLIAKKGLDFQLRIPDDLPDLLFDPLRIRQILLNLLVNAARFTSEGGISVSVAVGERAVTTTVVDTGIGMSDADIKQAFDEFYQVEGGAHLPDRGTGLGLTLSRELIRLHDGEMSVSSSGIPGEGSRFSFSLPTTRSLVSQMPAAGRQNNAGSGEKRVLVVDEDEAITAFFMRYLKGHRIAVCHSESDARRAIDDFAPDALLLSQNHGWHELLDHIERHAPTLHIITLPMPSGRAAIRGTGISDYLVKPVSRETLRKSVAQYGEGARSIMIIDDNRDIVRLFTQTLRGLHNNCSIRAAYDGADGLAQMQSDPPDLLILDVLMPGMDGFALIERMAASETLRRIPVILVSAKGASESIMPDVHGDITLARQRGYSPSELVASIQSLIDGIRPPVDLKLKRAKQPAET